MKSTTRVLSWVASNLSSGHAGQYMFWANHPSVMRRARWAALLYRRAKVQSNSSSIDYPLTPSSPYQPDWMKVDHG